MSVRLALLGAVAVTAAAHAQPIRSPVVHEDRTVTFSLRAPGAQSVKVVGDFGGEVALAKDDGVWTGSSAPLKPGVWGYSFVVDGLRTSDPANEHSKPEINPVTSELAVPGDGPLPTDFRDVPHGTLHVHAYRASQSGRLRTVHVYTPPGMLPGEPVPVLYLLHGSGDNDATWPTFGRAAWIADNLVAAGKARPMVIVMPNGHAMPWHERRNGGDIPREQVAHDAVAAFEHELKADVMPIVAAHYPIAAGPANTAIAGLSMGGGQAVTVGLQNPETFGHVAGFSSYIPDAEHPLKNWSDQTASGTLWIACGKDDFLLEQNEAFVALLKERGIDHQWILTDGGHSWPVWRDYLERLIPLLFRE